jgi:hypothetical protein
LRALASTRAFKAVCDFFSVKLAATDRDLLDSEIVAYDKRQTAWKQHSDLWAMLASMEETGLLVNQVAEVNHNSKLEDDENPTDEWTLDSLRLAIRLDLPLLADDRRLQIERGRSNRANATVSFGSFHALSALLESTTLDVATVASDFRRLISWRYRFLIPSPDLLLHWAREAGGDPPGAALLDISAYLHDCLRDPGLLCGFEETEPPMPIAFRFLSTWNQVIARFLAGIWADATFTDEVAGRLTYWIAEELLPTCPRGLLLSDLGGRIAILEPSVAIKLVVVQFLSVNDRRRANIGLRILADALGFDDNEFIATATEAIDVVG